MKNKIDHYVPKQFFVFKYNSRKGESPSSGMYTCTSFSVAYYYYAFCSLAVYRSKLCLFRKARSYFILLSLQIEMATWQAQFDTSWV